MLSDGKARPNETADVSSAAKPAPEPRNTRDSATQTAKPAASAKRASAAASDEALAKEALEGLKRIRAKARLDKMAIPKPAPVVMKPAVIVAKPPPPRPTWVAPLATLAVAAILVVCACTGVIAYLTTQPAQNNVAANTEIRNLRETVAQLRKQVSGVSENLDGLRTAVDQSSKATNDRFGRFAENLDRIERVSSSSTVKLDKLAQAQAQAPAPTVAQSQPSSQAAPMMASLAAPEVTGSVSPSERASVPRKVVKGWSVRQAYEGIAILQSPNGVIEAVLGQQVPGLGRIEEIRNENGRLVVESSGGVIYSSRKATP
ncbi:hypothetical protein ACVI1J_002336 [Bradyrhizobium diazoefficiens]|jgi:hypothetical protein|uniref:Bll6844 protein n=2 Tax=Bradyrhizobium diazoefficiens TaxID=1355477 RepID=Q89F57_BRADU|nr:hypothetical protein [Bradyrhizobium diazoefficiens]MBP1062897.1 hypothetical protein [Bradyrhizobium japonicum]AND91849.1 hypothetical protein AAV28_31805 [Bradyrhizobium diazoefficiens USDA 110]APO50921.1 hypothetical protein BD122_11695 [Bradyrhizobium diazoefficiens]KGJ67257.1 hypothetical protein BJA5080_03877 [Bradyrhizobium diazoefficiens SEMIA 5080]KOY12447.1 hypothetical protein AF336_00015 [Bradyrhizobium diazoefficiens]